MSSFQDLVVLDERIRLRSSSYNHPTYCADIDDSTMDCCILEA